MLWPLGRKPAVVKWFMFAAVLVMPLSGAAEVSNDLLVRYLLATVQAFRTVYVEFVTERVKQVNIQAKEDWVKDSHSIMLPFQFVKVAGQELKTLVKGVDVGLVSLTPLYTSNFPKTEAEAEALKKLLADPKLKVLTFNDGKEFKGLSADLAIEQSCVDCHNHHPNSVKQDFKKGDVMGAIVVRLRL
ncbi:MAG TPA: DUF3365 domain-containing protein [Nitrospiraceae bacterium]|nr:DUF3365 domain-containing protein [Nitrospiraceae bacterium]